MRGIKKRANIGSKPVMGRIPIGESKEMLFQSTPSPEEQGLMAEKKRREGDAPMTGLNTLIGGTLGAGSVGGLTALNNLDNDPLQHLATGGAVGGILGGALGAPLDIKNESVKRQVKQKYEDVDDIDSRLEEEGNKRLDKIQDFVGRQSDKDINVREYLETP